MRTVSEGTLHGAVGVATGSFLLLNHPGMCVSARTIRSCNAIHVLVVLWGQATDTARIRPRTLSCAVCCYQKTNSMA